METPNTFYRAKLINDVARIIYASQGYTVDSEYDFSKATHPQERNCYAAAFRSYNHLVDTLIEINEDWEEDF